MSWTGRFRARLQGGDITPKYQLRPVKLPGGLTGGPTLTNVEERGFGLPLIADHPRLLGASIELRSWASRGGGFTVRVSAGDGRWMAQLKRGQLYELRMGFSGWSEGELEPIALGQVWQVQRRGLTTYQIVFRDFLSALVSRFSRTSGEQALFHTQGSTTLTSDYTVGDSSISVDSTSGFERSDDNRGGIIVYPSGADPWIVRYNSKTATSFALNTSVGFGTDLANASTGDEVREFFWWNSSPTKTLGEVLTSTGTADANGPLDILPARWGYGLDRRYVDVDDMTRWADVVTDSQTIRTLEPQENGLSWINTWLGLRGAWGCMRQGQITSRAIMPPNGSGYGNVGKTPIAATIDDDRIVRLDSWEAWDPSAALEYARVRADSFEGTGTGRRESAYVSEELTGYPTRRTLVLDAYSYGSGGDTSRDQLRDRAAMWYLRIPTRFTLTVGGLRWAGLCPGDWVRLSSRIVHGKLPQTVRGYEGWECLVTQVQPDLATGSVRLSLAALSNLADDYP